jgi:hypothetical protein
MIARRYSYSVDFKALDLGNIATTPAFGAIEGRIYADAVAASDRGPDVPAGMPMRELRRADVTGRQVSTFYGPETIFRQLNQRSQRVTRFHVPNGRAA